jgi:hypothetical protein
MPQYGQFPVPEPLHNLTLVHRHAGYQLHAVEHHIPLGVLEQENFAAQGIDTAALVPGAPRVDALGNCVFNAGTAAVSFLGLAIYEKYLDALGLWNMDGTQGEVFADTRLGEEAAIVAYHRATDLTGTTSTEWPPTDCGSSGVYLVQFLQSIGVITSQRTAHGAEDLVSLLQSTPVCVGGPFFNSWEEPGPLGMIDGNGTLSDLDAAIRSGVAGGHERLTFQVESIAFTASGQVDPEKTILVDRNSWGASWGDAGCYRVHLSTYVYLAQYMDFRALVA